MLFLHKSLNHGFTYLLTTCGEIVELSTDFIQICAIGVTFQNLDHYLTKCIPFYDKKMPAEGGQMQ